jgi:hypothetical protein
MVASTHSEPVSLSRGINPDASFNSAQVKRDIDVVRLPVILQALHLIEEITRLDILSATGDHESMEVRFMRFFAEENIGQF